MAERERHPILTLIDRWRAGKDRPQIVITTILIGIFVLIVVRASGWDMVVLLAGGLIGVGALDAAARWPDLLTSKYGTHAPVYVGLGALFVAPTTVKEIEFYSAVAQIVPVLLLAWILDARALVHPQVDNRWIALWTVLALIIAGSLSLDVIATGDVQKEYSKIVIAALAASVTGLVIAALTSNLHEKGMNKRHTSLRKPWQT